MIVNLGLIGAGRWGKCYISTVLAMENVRLTHLISSNPISKTLVPSTCTVSSHWQDLLKTKTLHGVIIATPPHTHAEMAIALIRAGLPVLIEKPMTMNVEDARAIIETAKKHNIYVAVDHTHLFSPAYCELKHYGKSLGRLKHIQSSGGNWGPFRSDTPVLWDYGPHDIALCLDLTDSYPRLINIKQEALQITPDGQGQSLHIELDFPQNIKAEVRLSNVDSKKSRWFKAVYEGGILKYDDLAVAKLSVSSQPSINGEHWTAIAIEETPPLTKVVRAFCDRIVQGGKFEDELNLSLRVIDILTSSESLLSRTSYYNNSN